MNHDPTQRPAEDDRATCETCGSVVRTIAGRIAPALPRGRVPRLRQACEGRPVSAEIIPVPMDDIIGKPPSKWFGWGPGLLIFGVCIMRDSTRANEVRGATDIGMAIGRILGRAEVAEHHGVEIPPESYRLFGEVYVIPGGEMEEPAE